MSKYKTLRFDFAEEAVERLDSLVVQAEVSTRAEVVRSALRLYEYIVGELNKSDKEAINLTINKDDFFL